MTRQEEIVSRDYILNQKPDGIINIVDATNIERNLYLTLQLLELRVPMVLALNMMDEVRANGGAVDVQRMSRELGIPVVPISAAKGEGVSELVDQALAAARGRVLPKVTDFCADDSAVHRCIHAVVHLIADHADRIGVPARFCAAKLIEGGDDLADRLALDQNERELLEHCIVQMETETGLDRNAALADMRYSFIENVVSASVVKCRESREHARSVKMDLHPELGIEIMRRTALDHHGDIQIKQDKEIGTSVTLYIPLGKEHFKGEEYVVFVKPEHIQIDDNRAKIITVEDKKKQELQDSIIPRPIESPETKYKILVIEDHADIRLYLKVLFGGTYNIIMAENGEEGVKVARKEIPDLIITDVMMPVMDGFECCRILKEDLKTCHIPIILLTALVGDEDVVKGIELGADDYILKPFNPEILRTKVKRLIKSRVELKQIYTKLLMPSINTIGDIQEENDIAIKIEDPFVTQILKIINDNLQNQEFNVKKLAEMLNMSQPTLYRRVKQLTNFTIIELVRGVRLKRSAELLRTKKYSVQEVAEMVGYNDIPTFRKHFVDFYGTTPSTFNSKEETEDKK